MSRWWRPGSLHISRSRWAGRSSYAALPAHRRVAWGAVAGLAIAALDLGLAHRSRAPRFAPVSDLPLWPQVADHVAFGALIGCAGR